MHLVVCLYWEEDLEGKFIYRLFTLIKWLPDIPIDKRTYKLSWHTPSTDASICRLIVVCLYWEEDLEGKFIYALYYYVNENSVCVYYYFLNIMLCFQTMVTSNSVYNSSSVCICGGLKGVELFKYTISYQGLECLSSRHPCLSTQSNSSVWLRIKTSDRKRRISTCSFP